VFFDTSKLLTRLTYLLEVPEFRVNVVHLVRDARGVAASAKRRGDSVVAASKVWLNDQLAVARLLSGLPPKQSIRIRYEDLCSSPADTLITVWASAVWSRSRYRRGSVHARITSLATTCACTTRFRFAWTTRGGPAWARRRAASAHRGWTDERALGVQPLTPRSRALVVACNFPPDASVGTMRTLRLVRHLAGSGWDVDVVTLDPEGFRPGTVVDPMLLDKVPAAMTVVRARSLRPFERLGSVVKRAKPVTAPPAQTRMLRHRRHAFRQR